MKKILSLLLILVLPFGLNFMVSAEEEGENGAWLMSYDECGLHTTKCIQGGFVPSSCQSDANTKAFTLGAIAFIAGLVTGAVVIVFNRQKQINLGVRQECCFVREELARLKGNIH